MRNLWSILTLLAVTWLLIAGGFFALRSYSSTPEKLEAYLRSHPLAGCAPPERRIILDKAASLLNRLDYGQRQRLRERNVLAPFVDELDPGERARFLEATLPAGFRQLLAELKRMKPVERQRVTRRLLVQIQANRSAAARLLTAEDIKKISEQGFELYYREADPRVKEDLAPLIDELTATVKSLQ